MSLLTHPDAGGDKKLFKAINRACQILTNDAEREAYNKFGLDEGEKFIYKQKWQLNCPYESTNFLYCKTFI